MADQQYIVDGSCTKGGSSTLAQIYTVLNTLRKNLSVQQAIGKPCGIQWLAEKEA